MNHITELEMVVAAHILHVCADPECFVRCCQTNAHKSQFCSNLNLLGCAEATPLGKSGGAVQLEI